MLEDLLDKLTVLVDKIFVFMDNIVETGFKAVQLCLQDDHRVMSMSRMRIGKIGSRRVRSG